MSSNPIGLRFSPFASSIGASSVGGSGGKSMQSGQTRGRQLQSTKATNTTSTSLSSSETDVSTSTENLSMEERYVLRHTARVEPQGQENMLENVPIVASENARFSSNNSMDSTRYPSSNRSISETRNPIYVQQASQQVQANQNGAGNGSGSGSNRNSLKETNSNRSSMDVSTCSYNTIIIHNDDSLYSLNGRDYPSPPPSIIKKDRPRSYGEQGIQEITQIPDDYLNQSHVLKHLAKEIKIPVNRRSNTRDSGVSENTDPKDPPKYVNWGGGGEDTGMTVGKVKSKSQPDLTRLTDIDLETIEALMKENSLLKQQLNTCYMKVAKTQKLEEEVANIYRVHEELVQSCERREKLERAARTRLQTDLQRVQELNKALKDQADIFQSQLLAPSEHQILIAQLFTQNKELTAAKDRQEIELAAQRATLQEQRNHIGILDTALTNTQHNMRRLEEELRKKQGYIERLTQLHQQSKQQQQNEERSRRFVYENELSKDSNRSGSSTNSESKWQIQDKANQITRLENEQRQLEEAQLRQNVAKAMEKTAQETDRIIAEAKQDKMRYLEEVHTAQRRVNELQAHLKVLESRLAEKDAVLRVLQGPKVCVASFDSYNLSTDSFAMSPLSYNSQGSFNVSNTSFHTATNTSSLLDPSPYSGNSASNFSPTPSISAAYGASPVTATPTPYGSQTPTPTYNHQSAMNLQSMGNYSPNSSSNYSGGNFDAAHGYGQQGSTYESSYDATRNSIDDHMKKQLDEQLSKKLAHIDQRERERQEKQQEVAKNEEIVLLEKQGRCSQKMRNNTMGNLVQVSQSVGQNMTDISNIGVSSASKVPKLVTNLTQNILPPRKERGSSLPPTASALPRPPRGLKPPRKIEYDRLSDSELKKRSQTPPKLAQRAYDLKTASLKRGDFCPRREFSPGKTYIEMKESMGFKHKDYGSIPRPTFSKPDFTSTRNYQRLEEASPRKASPAEASLKRSLLPAVTRKPTPTVKSSRDSLNSASSGSNNSNHSATNSRSSPVHTDPPYHPLHYHAKTPPKYVSLGPRPLAPPVKPPPPLLHHPGPQAASLPPKPQERRAGSVTRGENRYRIQF
ncbi:uncharacterized protein LOC129801671 isoform X2 [Phlebotomus papatasi]|uniref:uncharacterized protein LOC129801671 isoform X2 n=1 Tax=Phlebotomus papatasi TaxID=29031 RepID=UPI0024846187|nr:uncharacterized protein LOC129801671 isoform X2 [Phlebotomus papatasi]